jgi:thiol-disulfide isomerase/thioredoxin/sugar lactone lactonase YvrE
MSQADTPRGSRWTTRRTLGLVLAVALLAVGGYLAGTRWAPLHATPVSAREPAPEPQDAPQPGADGAPRLEKAEELDGGSAWLNTAGPVRLKDLRGKFVVLDFWTYCCINCIHTLPDLAKLEKKYANQLVVIGVHSAKFDNEKDSAAIRKAVLRYEISHPVVNDSEMKIWRRYHIRSWPTLVLIDPEGNYLGDLSGEGNYEVIDEYLTKHIPEYRKKKLLNEKPIKFELARYQEKGDSPLFFPGKVLADAGSNRLFIADSTHHRIVITDLTGKKIAVAGAGEPGKADGTFEQARFDDPQGMALKGETLYVADRRNHLIRALDLKARNVTTVAGTGSKSENPSDRTLGGAALTVNLNSPWDLWIDGERLIIAMAGHHQLWVLNLAKGDLQPFAGRGLEMIVNGPPSRACFAQPSGLASDGKMLYVADSEGSVVRSMPLDGKGAVRTIVGEEWREDLFEFGDVDGVGDKVRLQHALGVACHDGKVYVADTYNSKIKVIDPEKHSCETVLGGEPDGWLAGPLFNEPAGLSFAGDKLYVADTNAHRIRVVDLKTKKVSTLKLQGVEAPKKD